MLAAFFCWGILAFSAYGQQPDRVLVQNTNAPAGPAKRRALVIGNGAYANVATLKNPAKDARDMAALLTTLGFEVTSGIDVNLRQLRAMIREFEKYVLDTQAHMLMTPWWYRIIAARSYVKGWKISPSHYVNQDLANVWLDQ